MITVISRKYDGTVRRRWTCELLEHTGSLLVLVGEFESEIEHAGLGRIEKGTLSFEYYWLDRWYNIFRFQRPSGTLRNFYCNINMPPRFDGEVVDYVDLDIDVVVWPDHSYQILDREDYERNAEAFGYPTEVHENAEAALKELLEMIERRELPTAPETVCNIGERNA